MGAYRSNAVQSAPNPRGRPGLQCLSIFQRSGGNHTRIEAHWTFKEKTCGPRLPPLNVDVRRVQFPLAPALPKTIYALQGQTCEPGLVCHVALPKKLSEEARWLAYYVMLSRVRDLQSLRKVNRSILEGGPPARLQDAMENLFEKNGSYYGCQSRP